MDVRAPALRVLPPYRRVAIELRDQIHRGRWSPGDPLPSHRALATEFDVALNTITRAIACLIEEGAVATTERHGTFVNPQLAPNPAKAATAQTEQRAQVAPPTRTSGGHIAVITWTQDDPRADPTAPIRDVWSMTVQRQVETSLAAVGRRTRHYRVWSDAQALPSLEAALAAAAPAAPDAWIIINVNGHPGWDQVLLNTIDPSRIPAVLIAGPPTLSAMPQVSYDQARAGYLAAQHLARAGYTRAIFLRLAEASWLAERLVGAQAGWRDAGRTDATFSIHPPQRAGDYLQVLQGISDDQHVALVTAAIDSALQAGDLRSDGSTGIVVPTDHAALPLLKLLNERGIVPGRHIGVIGFDDLPASLYAGLSSVRPPLETLGSEAVAQILDGLGQSPLMRQVSLPSQVIARDSTRRDA
jgi:DNA-binding LacI/PurR family transcriptional regulator/DNA-binding transcriptional regulator YhcF (GntR family)